MLVVALAIASLMLLRHRGHSASGILGSESMPLELNAPVIENRPHNDHSMRTIHEDTGVIALDLEACRPKATSQRVAYSVMPVIDKKTLGVEFTVTF